MNKTNYKQYDTRWSKLGYPKSPWCIGNCGCGEVSVANCIIEMEKYKDYTPKTIQPYCKQYAAPNGDGTYFNGIPKMMEHYGMTEVKEMQTMGALWKELAKDDRVAIYLMGNRGGGTNGVHWTSSAHFVCSTDYKAEGGKHYVYVKDSNSTSSLRNGWISYEDNMRGDVSRVWVGKLPATKKKREPKTSKPTAPYKGSLPRDTVQNGSKGADVMRLKSFLNWYFNAKVLNPDNGNAGNKTVKWIKRFQKDVGLTPDGIFGAASKAKARQVIDKYASDEKESKYHSDKVIIGQACCNEFGTLSGGKAGDQTGKEVRFSDWSSSYGWKYVFRAKDKALRDKIAQAMIDTVRNQNIGYNIDKPARYGAWDNAENNGHNIRGIDKKGDTTCSQAVSMCLRAVGIPKKYAPRHMDIAVMTKVMLSSPYFKVYTDANHTSKSTYLQAGDILLSSHHTAIVVKSPNN